MKLTGDQQIESILKFYQDCLDKQEDVKAIVNKYDKKTLNRRIKEELQELFPYGSSIETEVTLTETAGTLKFYHKQNNATFFLLKSKGDCLVPMGKTLRVNAECILSSLEIQIEFYKKQMATIKDASENIDYVSNQVNGLFTQIESIRQLLPTEVIYSYEGKFNGRFFK